MFLEKESVAPRRKFEMEIAGHIRQLRNNYRYYLPVQNKGKRKSGYKY